MKIIDFKTDDSGYHHIAAYIVQFRNWVFVLQNLEIDKCLFSILVTSDFFVCLFFKNRKN